MESTTLNINLAAQIYGDVYHTVIADITFNVPATSPPSAFHAVILSSFSHVLSYIYIIYLYTHFRYSLSLANLILRKMLQAIILTLPFSRH